MYNFLGSLGVATWTCKVPHKQFMAEILPQAESVISVRVSQNNYGEFLFVTLRFRVYDLNGEDCGTEDTTFYGLGYHDGVGRIIADEWSFYDARGLHKKPESTHNEALNAIAERSAYLKATYPDQPKRTREQRTFEFIADLADDDFASIELEDCPWLVDELLGSEENE